MKIAKRLFGEALRQRTCISCRSSKDKHEMLRFFKTENSIVRIDYKGNMPGRGAYVCSEECMDTAIESGLIGRALRIRFENVFEDNDRIAIREYFSNRNKRSCKE